MGTYECNEDDKKTDVPKTRIIGVPNEDDNRQPPNLESKCNCTTMEDKYCGHLGEMKNHDTKGLYGKSCPNYDALCEIYSNDRARGLGAASAYDEVQQFQQEANHNMADGEGSMDAGFDFGLDDMDNFVVQPTESSSTRVDGSKLPCRKRTKQSEQLVNSLYKMGNDFGKFVNEMGPHFGTTAQAINYEKELTEQIDKEREMVMEELQQREDFDIDLVIDASDIFARDSFMVKVFLKMHEQRKKYYIEKITDRLA